MIDIKALNQAKDILNKMRDVQARLRVMETVDARAYGPLVVEMEETIRVWERNITTNIASNALDRRH